MQPSTRHALELAEQALRQAADHAVASTLYREALQAVRAELAHEQRPGRRFQLQVRGTRALLKALGQRHPW